MDLSIHQTVKASWAKPGQFTSFKTKATHTASLVTAALLLLERRVSRRVVDRGPGHVAAVGHERGLRRRAGGGVPGQRRALCGALVCHVNIASDHAVGLSREALEESKYEIREDFSCSQILSSRDYYT